MQGNKAKSGIYQIKENNLHKEKILKNGFQRNLIYEKDQKKQQKKQKLNLRLLKQNYVKNTKGLKRE